VKDEILAKLVQLKRDLRDLRRQVSAIPGDRVSRKAIREEADRIADTWVEDLRSPLEHKIGLDPDVIQTTADHMKQLHVLSRPNNRKQPYLRTVDAILKGFDDKLILPVKQTSLRVESLLDLGRLVPQLSDPAESEYLREATDCARAGYRRGAVVLGWCAAIDKMQKKVMAVGLDQFNRTSAKLKGRTSGRFKRFNKVFSCEGLSDLQEVFDRDLITVLEGLGLLDATQADRLGVCYQYRCHGAHPGEAPIEDVHLVAFLTDVSRIVLQNPRFN
jgi:hypothetical protein